MEQSWRWITIHHQAVWEGHVAMATVRGQARGGGEVPNGEGDQEQGVDAGLQGGEWGAQGIREEGERGGDYRGGGGAGEGAQVPEVSGWLTLLLLQSSQGLHALILWGLMGNSNKCARKCTMTHWQNFFILKAGIPDEQVCSMEMSISSLISWFLSHMMFCLMPERAGPMGLRQQIKISYSVCVVDSLITDVSNINHQIVFINT